MGGIQPVVSENRTIINVGNDHVGDIVVGPIDMGNPKQTNDIDVDAKMKGSNPRGHAWENKVVKVDEWGEPYLIPKPELRESFNTAWNLLYGFVNILTGQDKNCYLTKPWSSFELVKMEKVYVGFSWDSALEGGVMEMVEGGTAEQIHAISVHIKDMKKEVDKNRILVGTVTKSLNTDGDGGDNDIDKEYVVGVIQHAPMWWPDTEILKMDAVNFIHTINVQIHDFHIHMLDANGEEVKNPFHEGIRNAVESISMMVSKDSTGYSDKGDIGQVVRLEEQAKLGEAIGNADLLEIEDEIKVEDLPLEAEPSERIKEVPMMDVGLVHDGDIVDAGDPSGPKETWIKMTYLENEWTISEYTGNFSGTVAGEYIFRINEGSVVPTALGEKYALNTDSRYTKLQNLDNYAGSRVDYTKIKSTGIEKSLNTGMWNALTNGSAIPSRSTDGVMVFDEENDEAAIFVVILFKNTPQSVSNTILNLPDEYIILAGPETEFIHGHLSHGYEMRMPKFVPVVSFLADYVWEYNWVLPTLAFNDKGVGGNARINDLLPSENAEAAISDDLATLAGEAIEKIVPINLVGAYSVAEMRHSTPSDIVVKFGHSIARESIGTVDTIKDHEANYENYVIAASRHLAEQEVEEDAYITIEGGGNGLVFAGGHMDRASYEAFEKKYNNASWLMRKERQAKAVFDAMKADKLVPGSELTAVSAFKAEATRVKKAINSCVRISSHTPHIGKKMDRIGKHKKTAQRQGGRRQTNMMHLTVMADGGANIKQWI